ncbi:MAG: cyclic nucleotide-binding domain-containing protein [Verrucomicrobia bacterium]|nr:cyclic nucleotide-binding domain-containing protein [Verrucomicrobiota bacterium]
MLTIPSDYLRSYKTDDVIIQQGEANDNMIYILSQGMLGVYKDDVRVAEIKQEGIFFGEMSVLLNTSRTATVKALMESSVLVVPYDYNIFFVKFPTIAHKLMITLTRRLSEITAKHEETSAKVADLQSKAKKLELALSNCERNRLLLQSKLQAAQNP